MKDPNYIFCPIYLNCPHRQGVAQDTLLGQLGEALLFFFIPNLFASSHTSQPNVK